MRSRIELAAFFVVSLVCGSLHGAEPAREDADCRQHFFVTEEEGVVVLTPVDPTVPLEKGKWKVSCTGLRVEQQGGQPVVKFFDGEWERDDHSLAAKEIWVGPAWKGLAFPVTPSRKFRSEEARARYAEKVKDDWLTAIDRDLRESALRSALRNKQLPPVHP